MQTRYTGTPLKMSPSPTPTTCTHLDISHRDLASHLWLLEDWHHDQEAADDEEDDWEDEVDLDRSDQVRLRPSGQEEEKVLECRFVNAFAHYLR